MLQEEISYNVVIEKDRVFVSILCKSNQNTLYACYLNDAYSILQKKNYQSQNQFEFQCSDGKYFCTLFVKENGATESPVFIKTTFFTIRNCKIFCVADYDVISILSEEKSFHISQGEGFQLTVEEDKVLLDLAYLAENKFDIAECLSCIKSYVYKEAIIILVKCYEDAQINEYVDGFINSVNKLRQGNVFLINMHQILRKDQCRIVHENYNTFQETLLTKLNDIISFCEKRDKENINVNFALNENILSSTVSYLGKSLVPASYFFYLIKVASASFFFKDVFLLPSLISICSSGDNVLPGLPSISETTPLAPVLRYTNASYPSSSISFPT